MRLAGDNDVHLSYCTNIHPGETWAEVATALRQYLPAVKAKLCPGEDFGVGLRLSAAAADSLAEPAAFAELQQILADGGLYVFTINGFPYGTFHGARVKEGVYQPDWRAAERLAYSNRLADLMVELLPEDGSISGSISTVPGGFKPDVRGPADVAAMAATMLRHAAHLVELRRRTGRHIALALEPEPCCLLETTGEAVAFFQDHLFSAEALATLAAAAGLSLAEAETAARAHLGVCLDLCHAAVEFEQPGDAVTALDAAGIAIPKVQISAGLRLATVDAAGLDRLRPFNDDVYLHQVVARTEAGLERHLDLPEAFAAFDPARDREWRVHFHVPIFLADLDGFATTRPAVEAFLALQRRAPVTRHLEVETYTWEVLPPEHRRDDVVDNIVKELRWVRTQMAS
ncbi:MAG: metabolite traffic protein EboE [Alphaproteobacteria bacterium]|jgi:sugar phosphate isomerase/epimerase|nr:metabolite traffic protein EboE [Alphaproteobacteria bacterium]MDP6815842.1 metabolite traffic protein EboE [Alphaproteobacteria bacterium]